MIPELFSRQKYHFDEALLYIICKIFTSLMFNQLAISVAFAKAVDKPTTRKFLSVCADMKLVLETITSKTGPLSSPNEIKVKNK